MIPPFFESPESLEASQRRLLLISYHFPPAQTAGALRWEKFSHYAAERGWAMDVVTLHPSSLSILDTSQLATLPAGMRVYGVPDRVLWVDRLERNVWRGYRRIRRAKRATGNNDALAGVRVAPVERPRSASRPHSVGRAEIRWTLRDLPQGLRRGYYAWLDYTRQGQWASAAVDLCRGLSGSQTYSAVISCGPPHMVHEAARRVALATGVPLVMDLRDPWSLVERLPEVVASPLWLALAARYERQSIAFAGLIVMNTEPAQLALQARYPEARSRIVTVTNGYDADSPPRSRHGRRFTIAFAGAIYLDRNPRILFRAAARVVRELALRPTDFRIELMGEVESVDGVPTLVIAGEEGLGGFVGLRPPGPRREASQFLAEGSMLLSLPQDSDTAIPSKIFEYMQYDAWVLALADRDSATERLLRGSKADVVAPQDLEGLVAILRQRYLQFAGGERPTRLATDSRYSRREQARRLFDAIDECLPHGRTTRHSDGRGVLRTSPITR
jgi:glycosyltransferase involved in cell wall biosynthesis